MKPLGVGNLLDEMEYEEIDYQRLVSKKYRQMFVSVLKANPGLEDDLVRALNADRVDRARRKGDAINEIDLAKPTTTHWRMLSDTAPPPSVKNAVITWNKLRELRPDIDIPPPLIPIHTRNEYRALRIVQIMQAHDPERLDAMLEYMSHQCDEVELAAGVKTEDDLAKFRKPKPSPD